MTDIASKDDNQTDDGLPPPSHDVADAATPHAGEEDDGLIKSAQDFPFPWGPRYLIANIVWKTDGTNKLKIAATNGDEVPQEKKDIVIEFLEGLSEGTPMIEVAERARDTRPNRLERFF